MSGRSRQCGGTNNARRLRGSSEPDQTAGAGGYRDFTDAIVDIVGLRPMGSHQQMFPIGHGRSAVTAKGLQIQVDEKSPRGHPSCHGQRNWSLVAKLPAGHAASA
jgi:hypothetical protein